MSDSMFDEQQPDAPMFSRRVKVVCGANTECFELEGQDIASVRDTLAEVMNIPDGAQVRVSGNGVEETYQLQNGDVVEFIQPSGSKG